MLRIIAAIGILTLFSCHVQKAGGHLSDDEGYIYYSQPAPQMRMQLFGDYKFHSIKRKHFKDVDKSFLQYTTAKANGTKPKLMYAAHTFVKPFYATMGVVYKGEQANEDWVAHIKQQLQDRFTTTFSTVDSFYTSLGTARYFSYSLRHLATGVTTQHREYLINNQQDLVRFYFWTSTNDTAMVFREAELILKNIR